MKAGKTKRNVTRLYVRWSSPQSVPPLRRLSVLSRRCCGLLGAALPPQEEQEPRVVAVQESLRPLHRQEGESDPAVWFIFVAAVLCVLPWVANTPYCGLCVQHMLAFKWVLTMLVLPS